MYYSHTVYVQISIIQALNEGYLHHLLAHGLRRFIILVAALKDLDMHRDWCESLFHYVKSPPFDHNQKEDRVIYNSGP